MILKIENEEEQLLFNRYVQAVAANRGWTPDIVDSEEKTTTNPIKAISVFKDALLTFCENERQHYLTTVQKPAPIDLTQITITLE